MGEGVESGAAATALNTEQYLHSEEPSVLQLCKRWYSVAIFSIIREPVTSRRTILSVFWPKSDFLQNRIFPGGNRFLDNFNLLL